MKMVVCDDCEQAIPASEAKSYPGSERWYHKTNCCCHACDGLFDFASARLTAPHIIHTGDEIPIHLEPGLEPREEFRVRFGPDLCRPCQLLHDKLREGCISGVTIHRPGDWWDGPIDGLCRYKGVALRFDTVFQKYGCHIWEAFVEDEDGTRIPVFRFCFEDKGTRIYHHNAGEPLQPGRKFARSKWELECIRANNPPAG